MYMDWIYDALAIYNVPLTTCQPRLSAHVKLAVASYGTLQKSNIS
jgi:hypothetical protein